MELKAIDFYYLKSNLIFKFIGFNLQRTLKTLSSQNECDAVLLGHNFGYGIWPKKTYQR